MKTTRRFLRPLAFVLSALLGGLLVSPMAPAPTVSAQSIIWPSNANGVGYSYADDGDPWAVIWYVGPSTGTTTTQNDGSVEVEADTDIVFLSGPAGSLVADTSLECPVSGALGGIIDVDDAACNTAGEVCDIINAPTSNFRCVLLGALRTDVVNDRILDSGPFRASSVNGATLNWDTSTAFEMTALLAPNEFLSARKYRRGARGVNHDVWEGTRAVLTKASTLSTFGSGTSNLTVYSVDVENSATPYKSTETANLIFQEAGGATTVAKVYDLGAPFGVPGRLGEKTIVRYLNSAAMATAYLKPHGYFMGPVARP